jgi:hypothetical protein
MLPLDPHASDDKYPYMQGVVQVVVRPSDDDLVKGDAQAAANLDRPCGYQATPSCDGAPPRFPLPAVDKGATPIEHVFVVVRENKTYDAVLGDLSGANGDPKLVLFSESVTPNVHALARAFANLDNFYSLAEQSLQGHEWTTASIANDYSEKAWLTTWGRGYRSSIPFGTGPLAHLSSPGSDTIWQHLDKAGLAYKNYGEVVNSDGARTGPDNQFPGVYFSLDVADVEKVAYVTDELASDPLAVVPFTYLLLPRDHTYGTAPGRPTPQSMVADNDEATGRFVDALSHSPLWRSSLVFVIEDDPSDGGDHVEMHRSVAVVISPWVRRGFVSHGNYDVAAMYRTIELVLGLGPMNINDAHAAAMYDLFTTTPDYTPFTYLPSKVPLAKNSDDAPLAEESAKIDFSRPDSAPLGRILWKAMRGASAEPPWLRTRATVVDQDD